MLAPELEGYPVNHPWLDLFGSCVSNFQCFLDNVATWLMWSEFMSAQHWLFGLKDEWSYTFMISWGAINLLLLPVPKLSGTTLLWWNLCFIWIASSYYPLPITPMQVDQCTTASSPTRSVAEKFQQRNSKKCFGNSFRTGPRCCTTMP